MMRRPFVRLAIPAVMLAGLVPAADERPVWFWSATCGGPAMAVEVRFDGRTIMKAAYPLCQALRGSVHVQGESVASVDFLFRPARDTVWTHREVPDKLKAGKILEGHVWQAGADPDKLIIGLSFTDEKFIYMNELHIAHPSRRDDSTVGDGLTISTYPIAEKHGRER